MINLVLITSVIKTPNTRLSYSYGNRSVYSHQERFEQTKVTISSIRENIPNLKILIIECSDLNKEEEEYFIKNSDYFINLYGSECLREKIYSISKSLGEGTMTTIALKYMINNNIKFDNLFKISGRYWLSDTFNYGNFNNNNIVIKYFDGYQIEKYRYKHKCVITSLYKISYDSIHLLYEFLIGEDIINEMNNCIEYEYIFGKFIYFLKNIKKYNIIHLDRYGIRGLISVNNLLLDE